MKLNQAKKRMKTIEKSINKIRESGFSVFVVDNEKIVLESPSRINNNDTKFNKETKYNSFINGGMKSPELEYDYEILL